MPSWKRSPRSPACRSSPSGTSVRGRIPRGFFARDSVTVAREILGLRLVRETDDGVVDGIIVEAEAYHGADDPASHAYRGRTPRNASMFGEAGHAYVYFTYGMHYCMNVVTGEPGVATAVLIRAVRPERGIALMARRRGVDPARRARLAAGPAMVCQAFAITRVDDGCDLLRGPLRLTWGENVDPARIRATPRIGIRRATERPWRFVVAGEHSAGGRA